MEMKPPEVDLQWTAVYKDGTVLPQAYQTPQERNFGNIDLNRLSELVLEGQRGRFSVNPNTGEFDLNGFKFTFRAVDIPRGLPEGVEKYDLIYFRRVREDFAPEGQKTTVRHAIGLKALAGESVRQLIVLIEPDNSFTFINLK